MGLVVHSLPAVGATTVTAMVMGLTDEHVATIVTLAAGVGAIVGGITWLEKRMSSILQKHEEKEDLLANERHQGVLREIAHVKELVDIRGEIRKLREVVVMEKGEEREP